MNARGDEQLKIADEAGDFQSGTLESGKFLKRQAN